MKQIEEGNVREGKKGEKVAFRFRFFLICKKPNQKKTTTTKKKTSILQQQYINSARNSGVPALPACRGKLSNPIDKSIHFRVDFDESKTKKKKKDKKCRQKKKNQQQQKKQ